MDKYIIIREIFKNIRCEVFLYNPEKQKWIYHDNIFSLKDDFYKGVYDNIPFAVRSSSQTTLNLVVNRLVNDQWELIIKRTGKIPFANDSLISTFVTLTDAEINHIKLSNIL